MDTIAAARRALLYDRDGDAGLVRGDRGGRSGRAEADHEHIYLDGQLHSPALTGAPVMIRSGSDPSHPTAASRTIA